MTFPMNFKYADVPDAKIFGVNYSMAEDRYTMIVYHPDERIEFNPIKVTIDERQYWRLINVMGLEITKDGYYYSKVRTNDNTN